MKKTYKKISEKLSVNDKHVNIRTLLFGPSYPTKTNFMLEKLSRIPNRDIYIITKRPLEQHSISEIKIEEKGDEIKPLNKYENVIIVLMTF